VECTVFGLIVFVFPSFKVVLLAAQACNWTRVLVTKSMMILFVKGGYPISSVVRTMAYVRWCVFIWISLSFYWLWCQVYATVKILGRSCSELATFVCVRLTWSNVGVGKKFQSLQL